MTLALLASSLALAMSGCALDVSTGRYSGAVNIPVSHACDAVGPVMTADGVTVPDTPDRVSVCVNAPRVEF